MANLARLLGSSGPLSWEIARQTAALAATGGEPESNPDPLWRVRLEDLLRVAEMHVSEATDLPTPGESPLRLNVVTASAWAMTTLEDWKGHLERLASKMAEAMKAGQAPQQGPGEAPDPLASMLGNLPHLLGPFLSGLQAGSLVGQLAASAMGQYDLPVPRPRQGDLVVVGTNIERFARDWSLDRDDVGLWICLREVTNHAVLSRAHVRARLDSLIGEYIDAFDPDLDVVRQRLEGVDPTDWQAFQATLADPASLLGDLQNEAQRAISGRLGSLLAVVTGYVDHVMDQVGRRLIGSYAPLTEALRRLRLEQSPGTTILAQLFGVNLDAGCYEMGKAFIQGVIDRAGPGALPRLWQSDRELPTPAELEAPGLWLARIDLPE